MKKLILAALLVLAFTSMICAGNPQVKTHDGILEGLDKSGVKVFLGVPYAKPPVGDLRWKAPQPVEKWDGVRKAQEFGPDPMQQPIFGDMNFLAGRMSEDCLYLNIWTPAKSMNEKLPVLIYFNGGGLMAGSGSEPRYAGWSMARMGIISITVNYREGIFGFFAHPELSEESDYKGSGNYGFLDQVAAIRWVKDNIEAFGGDPERITIAGESAGSMSVSALMASPLCSDLFAQAIGSSGSVLGFYKLPTLKDAESYGMEKAKQIGCSSLSELRSLSAEELMNRAAISSVPIYNIDGYFFVEQPCDTYAQGKQAKVPLLVGGNSNEADVSFILRGQEASLDAIKATVERVFGANADKILDWYGVKEESDVHKAGAVQLASDMFIGFSTWKWGHMHGASSGMAVYRYNYCHPRPDMKDKNKVAGLAGGIQDRKPEDDKKDRPNGAVHSADIEYAMGTLPTNRAFDWQPCDYFVSEIFQNYYVNFVKAGNPNGLGLVEWPSANSNGSGTVPVLQIDVDTYVKSDRLLEERYEFIDSLLIN